METINIIIIGIASTLIYEIGKWFVSIAIDASNAKNRPFSITGYWITYHEALDVKENKVYGAYEIMQLKHRNSKIQLRIYQLTNDNRKHFYKGIGYFRGNELSLCYAESNANKSNLTGALVLQLFNYRNHMVCLQGGYVEFKVSNMQPIINNYVTIPLHISRWTKMKMLFLKPESVYRLMAREAFKSECKKRVCEVRKLLSW